MSRSPKSNLTRWKVQDFKAKLSEALRSVEAGEHVLVTSRGRPVALVVSPNEEPGRAQERTRKTDTTQYPSDPLGQLRWLQEAQLRAVAVAPDERTRTQAAKEARALTEKIGKLTGELREVEAGDLARYERMQPSELLDAVLALAEEIREAIRGE